LTGASQGEPDLPGPFCPGLQRFLARLLAGALSVLGDVAFGVDWGVTGTVTIPTTGKNEQRPIGATATRQTSRNRKATRVSMVKGTARPEQTADGASNY
jgi:hypothetical protein